MTEKQIEELIKKKLVDYLNQMGQLPDKAGRYHCISPDHTDGNPSMTIHKSGTYATCWSHPSPKDTFTLYDAIGIFEGIQSPRAQKKRAYELYLEETELLAAEIEKESAQAAAKQAAKAKKPADVKHASAEVVDQADAKPVMPVSGRIKKPDIFAPKPKDTPKPATVEQSTATTPETIAEGSGQPEQPVVKPVAVSEQATVLIDRDKNKVAAKADVPQPQEPAVPESPEIKETAVVEKVQVTETAVAEKVKDKAPAVPETPEEKAVPAATSAEKEKAVPAAQTPVQTPGPKTGSQRTLDKPPAVDFVEWKKRVSQLYNMKTDSKGDTPSGSALPETEAKASPPKTEPVKTIIAKPTLPPDEPVKILEPPAPVRRAVPKTPLPRPTPKPAAAKVPEPPAPPPEPQPKPVETEPAPVVQSAAPVPVEPAKVPEPPALPPEPQPKPVEAEPAPVVQSAAPVPVEPAKVPEPPAPPPEPQPKPVEAEPAPVVQSAASVPVEPAKVPEPPAPPPEPEPKPAEAEPAPVVQSAAPVPVEPAKVPEPPAPPPEPEPKPAEAEPAPVVQSDIEHYQNQYRMTAWLDDLETNVIKVDWPYALPTGLSGLDELLAGGIRPGLNLVCAKPGAGKTALALQIADFIAAEGQDVLWISLDMSREELLAGSLARLTLQQDSTINKKNACPVQDILKALGEKPDKAILQRSLQVYRQTMQTFYCHEVLMGLGLKDIEQLISRHMALTGNKPVVVIDSLQSIRFAQGQTDAENMNQAVRFFRQLGRAHRLPVLALSSLIRDDYDSDLVLVMQLEPAAGTLADPHVVRLEILKNRYGPVGKKLPLHFFAAFSCFEEQ